MKTLIIYDSSYGNTEKIARAIAGALSPSGEVKIFKVSEANSPELKSLDLLVIGSPTQGGRYTAAIQDFLNRLSSPDIKVIKVATFDTRLTTKWVKIFGYAAEKIADNLKGKGANPVANPEGFFVTGSQGPLKEGELERAAVWAKGLIK